MIKERRKEQVLQFAREVFSEKGFYEASISDIIERAGIARGTFYLYFENKRHLFNNILDNIFEELGRRVKTIELGEGVPHPVEQLRDNISRVVTFLLSNREITRILLYQAEGLDDECHRRLREFYERLADRLEISLKKGVQMGLIRKCNTHIVAHSIIGCVREVMSHVISHPDHAPDSRVLVDEILGFGLRGIFAGPALE